MCEKKKVCLYCKERQQQIEHMREEIKILVKQRDEANASFALACGHQRQPPFFWD